MLPVPLWLPLTGLVALLVSAGPKREKRSFATWKGSLGGADSAIAGLGEEDKGPTPVPMDWPLLVCPYPALANTLSQCIAFCASSWAPEIASGAGGALRTDANVLGADSEQLGPDACLRDTFMRLAFSQMSRTSLA